MGNYVTKEINEYEVYACFNIESEKLVNLCDEVSKTYPDVYLNCYNWEALLYHYIQNNSPELLIDLDCDVEETDYIAIYQVNDTNEHKVEKFISIITNFVENKKLLLDYIKDNLKEIEWE